MSETREVARQQAQAGPALYGRNLDTRNLDTHFLVHRAAAERDLNRDDNLDTRKSGHGGFNRAGIWRPTFRESGRNLDIHILA